MPCRVVDRKLDAILWVFGIMVDFRKKTKDLAFIGVIAYFPRIKGKYALLTKQTHQFLVAKLVRYDLSGIRVNVISLTRVSSQYCKCRKGTYDDNQRSHVSLQMVGDPHCLR